MAVVFPVRIPLPRFLTNSSIFILRTLRLLNPPSQDELDSTAPKERTFFELGLNSAPVLAVLVLLASRSIDGTTLRMGIVGEETGVKPYDISELRGAPSKEGREGRKTQAHLRRTLLPPSSASLHLPRLPFHLPRCYWTPPLPRLPRISKRRLLRAPALPELLRFLLRVGNARWKRSDHSLRDWFSRIRELCSRIFRETLYPSPRG